VLQDWPKKSEDIVSLETLWLGIIERLTEHNNIVAFNEFKLWTQLYQLSEKLSLDG
jgi:hypothetical protein